MPNTSSPFTIIYIIGTGHIGSTLLDLLISSHSSITSIGEIKLLSGKKSFFKKTIISKKCTCGAKSYQQCPFWEKVNSKMINTYGISLWEVNLNNKDPETFKLHNFAVFESVRYVSGCRYIVDSSKNYSRLKMLLDTRMFDIRPLHLDRNPYGVAYSNRKKGRSYISTAFSHQHSLIWIRGVLSSTNYFYVTYEELVNDPKAILNNIMNWVGPPFEEKQLNWVAHEHHNLGGNRMRYISRSEIKPDTSWREGLSFFQKLFITCIIILGRFYWFLYWFLKHKLKTLKLIYWNLKYRINKKIREFFK